MWRHGFSLLLALALAVGCTAAPEVDGPPEAAQSVGVAEPIPLEAPGEQGSRSDDGGGRRGTVAVTRIVDGDTIEVRMGGRIVDVRLIGIDTPETVAPGEPVGCFGPEASEFAARSLDGQRVRLTFDVERKDRYGRTLAYVWRNGMFNLRAVELGYATAYPYEPNTRYAHRFAAAQRRARTHDRGLWGACRDASSEGSSEGWSATGVRGSGGGDGHDAASDRYVSTSLRS